MTTTLDRIRSITDNNNHLDLSPDDTARAIWSLIAEPGDADAGRLVREHGAHDALAVVLEPTQQLDDEATDLSVLRARVLPRFSEQIIAVAFAQAHRIGAHVITPSHDHWPTGFGDLGDHAPHALWVRGDSALLADRPSTAVVGARAATGYGEHVTMEIAAGLVERGHTIVSGAAYGIDGMAHRAALACDGRTVAYLAGGVDRYYPSGHDALLTRIAEDGAVVSEVGCGQSPTKWRFLQRNRLIAAYARATLVVEAGWRSGSLNTAGHATALGRPLGAVPGPVTSAASAGCHRLIREFAATVVTNVDEAAELQPSRP